MDMIRNDLPLGLPPLREIGTKLIFYQALLHRVNQLIGVILISQNSFNDKPKSCLSVGTLGKV